jgi:hypothetical protein
MKIYKLLLVLLIPVFSSFCIHKYYLSVTDLKYNEEEKSIQMITRLFYDDLEEVLQERYDETILVDKTADQDKLDRYIARYFKAKLEIKVNGTLQEINYLGKEYEDDYIVCYLEVIDIETINELEIKSTLLMDLFTEQKNMVHTDILGKKKSLLLRDGNTKALLNFSE